MDRIWSERPLPPEYLPLVDGFEVVGPEANDLDSVIRSLEGVHGTITGARIPYNAALFAQYPSLKVVSRTGIGVDNIVLADATAHGVVVCNTPDGPTASTAELTLTLMLAATKHLKKIEFGMLRGETRDFFSDYRGVELDGLRLGLVGLGRIGGRVARVAQALGMSVLGFDPYVSPARASELGIEIAPDLETLLRTSDIVSLHAPSTPETRHLMNAERFAMMKPGAFLINAARGPLVDEAALLAALERGHLSGAGLDVYDPEPPDMQNPLLYRNDVIATPHIAGTTVASKDRMWREAIMQTVQVLRGERPKNLVNPDVWERRK